jgi:hypothetical protein
MEIPEIPGNTYHGTTAHNPFEGMGHIKVDSLKEAIKEIEMQIEERKVISASFDREGEKMKRDISNFLLENSPKGIDDTEFARERAELRKKGIEINEMQLKERVDCWRDVVTLKRDLREKQKELFERENRLDTINKILGEN